MIGSHSTILTQSFFVSPKSTFMKMQDWAEASPNVRNFQTALEPSYAQFSCKALGHWPCHAWRNLISTFLEIKQIGLRHIQNSGLWKLPWSQVMLNYTPKVSTTTFIEVWDYLPWESWKPKTTALELYDLRFQSKRLHTTKGYYAASSIIKNRDWISNNDHHKHHHQSSSSLKLYELGIETANIDLHFDILKENFETS